MSIIEVLSAEQAKLQRAIFKNRRLCSILRLLSFGIINRRKKTIVLEEQLKQAYEDAVRYERLMEDTSEAVHPEAPIAGFRVSHAARQSAVPVSLPHTYGHNWEVIRHEILERDGYLCQESDTYCTGPLQVHHVIPLSKGGTNASRNLVTLCHYHHCFKHPHMQRRH